MISPPARDKEHWPAESALARREALQRQQFTGVVKEVPEELVGEVEQVREDADQPQQGQATKAQRAPTTIARAAIQSRRIPAVKSPFCVMSSRLSPQERAPQAGNLGQTTKPHLDGGRGDGPGELTVTLPAGGNRAGGGVKSQQRSVQNVLRRGPGDGSGATGEPQRPSAAGAAPILAADREGERASSRSRTSVRSRTRGGTPSWAGAGRSCRIVGM